MITILLVIVILAIIGHILEINFSDTRLIDFSSIRKRFKNKEKTSSSNDPYHIEGYFNSIDRYCETVKEVFGKKENPPKSADIISCALCNAPPFFKYEVKIPFNKDVNVFEIIGLDKYRWIIDWERGFELSICDQKQDLHKLCNTGFTDLSATKCFDFSKDDLEISIHINCDTGNVYMYNESNVDIDTFKPAIVGFYVAHI